MCKFRVIRAFTLKEMCYSLNIHVYVCIEKIEFYVLVRFAMRTLCSRVRLATLFAVVIQSFGRSSLTLKTPIVVS